MSRASVSSSVSSSTSMRVCALLPTGFKVSLSSGNRKNVLRVPHFHLPTPARQTSTKTINQTINQTKIKHIKQVRNAQVDLNKQTRKPDKAYLRQGGQLYSTSELASALQIHQPVACGGVAGSCQMVQGGQRDDRHAARRSPSLAQIRLRVRQDEVFVIRRLGIFHLT